MKAIVINCSAKHYNLGQAKLADWLTSQGHTVEAHSGDPHLFAYGFDLVCLSVVFSWDAPAARQLALRLKGNSEVWCGGPGMTGLSHWWKRETGLECHTGLDWRFERQRGRYRMTFASRGCPVGCYFCIVPRIEGAEFTLDYDFIPAPILCDNNLSALPAEFQEHIIRRYIETDTPLLDANSGFEPAAFSEDTYRRWKPILHGPWRFAFDEQRERGEVKRMMGILKAESPRRKRVYVLVGNEPVESCYERALRVIEWGGEPFCQFLKPLNWLGDVNSLKPRFDWTVRLGVDFCRYFNRHLWRSIPLAEYKPRKNNVAPFGSMFSVNSFGPVRIKSKAA